jgi:outer membrane protein assembly factor BamA
MGGGNDQFLIDTKNSRIKIRLIGGKGEKVLAINNTNKRMDYYGNPDHTSFTRGSKNVNNHFATDSLNTRFVPVNLYNKTQPLITAGYNLDDGILFGAGFRHFHQGFRKIPYGNIQEVMLSRSFSTRALRLDYNGEWFQAIGSANLIVKATVKYPSNTQNFFGRGNETEKITVTDPGILFYRTRFNLFQLTTSLKWQNSKGTIFSAGPTIQYYSLEKSENEGRLININEKIGSYDSATIDRAKLHAGLALTYSRDRRNNKVFPSWGSYINVSLLALDGLNQHSRSFIQIAPEITIYKSLNARRTIIFSDRIGGGITVGESAFYQSLFLGGQGNLYGFSQYRFAGQHTLFNNVELRMKLADVGSYIAPGQLGLTTFFDVGRVWEKAESSTTWHYGYGGGLYFAPAQLIVLQLVAGHSAEGWYPYFHVNFRY